jgi:hypothetical protein
MVGAMQKHWHDHVLRTAQFDNGCKTMRVVDTQHGTVDSRYRVAGCGKSIVYLCEDASRTQMDEMDLLVMGGRSGDVTCKPVRQ